MKHATPTRPLFLYVPFNAVHAPHQVPDSYKAPYSHLAEPRRTYAGMLAAMDEQVGEIVDALERSGISNNTLVIFSSDNGGPQPGVVTSNGPLRAGKATLYEGGVRVPGLRDLARADQGRHGRSGAAPHRRSVSDPPDARRRGWTSRSKLDGYDAWPTIAGGQRSPHGEILINAAPGGGAILVGEWKLVIGGFNNEANLDRGQSDLARRKPELYDLTKDIAEKNNVAATHPDKVKETFGEITSLPVRRFPQSGPQGERLPLASGLGTMGLSRSGALRIRVPAWKDRPILVVCLEYGPKPGRRSFHGAVARIGQLGGSLEAM